MGIARVTNIIAESRPGATGPLLGALFASTIALAPAAATESMTLLDASGNRVGPVLAVDTYSATVPFRLYGQRVLLQLSPSGQVIAPAAPRVVYHTPDCSGHAYVLAGYPAEHFFGEYAVTDRTVVWIADPEASLKTMDVHSSGSPSSCVTGLKLRTSVLSALSVDLASRFTFPLRVVVDTPTVDLADPTAR
jgi:hypothetical protein